MANNKKKAKAAVADSSLDKVTDYRFPGILARSDQGVDVIAVLVPTVLSVHLCSLPKAASICRSIPAYPFTASHLSYVWLPGGAIRPLMRRDLLRPRAHNTEFDLVQQPPAPHGIDGGQQFVPQTTQRHCGSPHRAAAAYRPVRPAAARPPSAQPQSARSRPAHRDRAASSTGARYTRCDHLRAPTPACC